MAKAVYSLELCRELIREIGAAELIMPYRPPRYERHDVISLDLTAVWPEVAARGTFCVEKFVGGGFAGQVYRCTVERVETEDGVALPGLREGGTVAVKILVPPTRFSRWFRDVLYWVGFQAPFSGEVNRAACRAGLLWQKLVRHAAGVCMGTEDAVADVYASFFDTGLQAYGEVREWVEGRTWRLEADPKLKLRRRWQSIDPAATGSPEYVAKRRFMAQLVELMQRMGAPELARQYRWWTMKSQPNVLKRAEAGQGAGEGLCAVDFRAGLVLLPFLPMSPADLGLIFSGLARGSLVQFDRCDFEKLRAFLAAEGDGLAHAGPMAKQLDAYDQSYRASMPDITHQGVRLLWDRTLRRSVRRGLAEGYRARDLVDDGFEEELPSRPGRFALFYMLGAVPFLGRFLRRLWGNGDYRNHLGSMLRSWAYLRRTFRAGLARRLVEWHRAGRAGEERTRLLLRHPALFWLQRLTLGFLPPKLHRCLAEPAYVKARMNAAWHFVRMFYRDADFRQQWLTDLVELGHREGTLDAEERETILGHVRDEFIVKYLKCLAVHFATLPVTQSVSVLVGAGAAAHMLATGGSWGDAGLRFAAVLVIFQVIPVSPGSLCRGAYVLYIVIRERDFRDYMIAVPLSFVKYIGYFAFPFQMATTYPELSRFMASRWATHAVHVVPVFGEKGALLEHMVFDLFFNVPRGFGRWARRRMKLLLDLWLILGLLILLLAFRGCELAWTSKGGVNLLIAVTSLFVLPRVLFYPMLRRKSGRQVE